MSPGEQIKRSAPAEAVFYQLVLHHHDGKTTTFPSEDEKLLLRGEVGNFVPGTYTVLYLNIDGKTLSTPRPVRVVFTAPHDPARPKPQLDLALPAPPQTRSNKPERQAVKQDDDDDLTDLDRGWNAMAEDQGGDEETQESRGDAGDDDEDKDADQDETEDEERRQPTSLAARKQELEHELRLLEFQQRVQVGNSKLLRQHVVSKELTGVQAHNVMLRREMVESGRVAAAGHRRELELIREVQRNALQNVTITEATNRKYLEMSQALADAQHRIATMPPPPSTDWGPVISTGIMTLGRVVEAAMTGTKPALRRDDAVEAAIGKAAPPESNALLPAEKGDADPMAALAQTLMATNQFELLSKLHDPAALKTFLEELGKAASGQTKEGKK